MATICMRKRKNGKPSYTATIRVKGYRTESATFERKTDAVNWANALESQMKRGKHIKDAEAKKHTLAELIDKYIAEKLPERRTNQQSFKAQLLWWKDKIGSYILSDITSKLLSDCRNDLVKEPSKRATINQTNKSGATVNRYMAALSIVLTKAYKEWEWIEENPMLKVDKCKETRGRTRFLSAEEQKALLDACAETHNLLHLLVILALATGARQGELTGLKWENVKFDDSDNNATLLLMDTKNKEHRSVTIDGVPYNHLKEYSKIRRIDTKYVFPRKDGKAPYDLRKQWYKALEKAGIKDFRFHDLRHTTASNLAMNGASLRDIAEILGHKTMQMTQRYSHLTQKYSSKVLSDLNKRQFGA